MSDEPTGGSQPPSPNNNWTRSLGIWVAVIALLATSLYLFDHNIGLSRGGKTEAMGYSDFLDQVAAHRIRDAELSDTYLIADDVGGKKYRVNIIQGDSRLTDELRSGGVHFSVASDNQNNVFLALLLNFGPFLLLFVIGFYVVRQLQKNAGGGAMGFGRSRAKLLSESKGRVTFDDVAGIDEARDELQEIVEFLRDPTKFARLGGKIPKGALLVGSPGTGKTL
ncbi:MAG: cell division protein FtsH, partial [Alphaproteobacteria bacterium]|nr:cell division protein FtsH [Alphaproteobacteria bacterium]